MKQALARAVLALMFVGCARSPTPLAPSPDPRLAQPAVEVAGDPGAAQVARSREAPPTAPAPPASASVVANSASMLTDHAIGAAKVFDNLTILPVTSKHQEDIGPITSLEDALAKKVAVVREMGAEQNGPAREGSSVPYASGGPQVNSLVIENKGDIAVYVLAGTIVKGGNQDRQIGDDFIVGAHTVVPVEAYCVEHGRWNAERNGVITQGQFAVAGVLTDSTVRTAAQYKHDQGEVWSKVASVNAANKKEAASGTLLATVDAGDIVVRRTALAQRVDAYLSSIPPVESVVGFAYAVDGKVRSVRWFTNHKTFELFRGTLVNTAAMEAITVSAQNVAMGRAPSASPPVAPAAVTSFVDALQDASVKEERTTPAMNVNRVRASEKGYGSSTMLKPPPAQPAAPAKPVSASFNAF
jgi:hypothetical protein